MAEALLSRMEAPEASTNVCGDLLHAGFSQRFPKNKSPFVWLSWKTSDNSTSSSFVHWKLQRWRRVSTEISPPVPLSVQLFLLQQHPRPGVILLLFCWWVPSPLFSHHHSGGVFRRQGYRLATSTGLENCPSSSQKLPEATLSVQESLAIIIIYNYNYPWPL